MREIKEIIVHCSGSDDPKDDSLQAIKELHYSSTSKKIRWNGEEIFCKGWSDIGYHIVITKDGVEFGRTIDKPGAHCRGRNSYSIGVCVTGNNIFTDKQKSWLIDLLKFLKIVFNLTNKDIKPHYFYNKNKTCPNFDLYKLLKELND